MRKFLDLTEAKGMVVFTFGRFNPPTTGHEKLIQKVASVAGTNPYRIYPSQSQNQKKDPLPFALKVAYMRKMFPRYAKSIRADKNSRTAIDIAVKLYDEGFRDLVMVVGSDRVKEFSSLLKTYNGISNFFLTKSTFFITPVKYHFALAFTFSFTFHFHFHYFNNFSTFSHII